MFAIRNNADLMEKMKRIGPMPNYPAKLKLKKTEKETFKKNIETKKGKILHLPM